jgi:hypothetical protein
MTPETGSGQDSTQPATDNAAVGERIRSALVVAGGAAMMVGLVVAAMAMLTSHDSWVMKAANQAMLDQQQAIATSYLINHGE